MGDKNVLNLILTESNFTDWERVVKIYAVQFGDAGRCIIDEIDTRFPVLIFKFDAGPNPAFRLNPNQPPRVFQKNSEYAEPFGKEKYMQSYNDRKKEIREYGKDKQRLVGVLMASVDDELMTKIRLLANFAQAVKNEDLVTVF
jgi:hypothetical protein